MWTCVWLIVLGFIKHVELCEIGTYGRCTQWASCSNTCGGGTQSRKCYSCFWGIEKKETRDCNKFCYNNGTYSQGSCYCHPWRYGRCCDYCKHIDIEHCLPGQQGCGGSPDGIKCTQCSDPYYPVGFNQGCKACPSIANCKRKKCTTALNTKCLECNDDKTIFKKTHSDTQCERMCAWNNHYCWPGSCTGELTRGCTCAPGFTKVGTLSETSCQPKTPATIMTCNTVYVGPNGEKKQALSSTSSTACQYLSDMYGNFQLSTFEFNMDTEYTVNKPNISTPAFIQEYKFGVTDTTVNVLKETISGARSTVSIHKQLIDTSSSEKANRQHHDKGNISVTSTSYNLLDGQALCLEFETKAGGYLKSRNSITHDISAAVPYHKVHSSRTICYRYDATPPRHCKESGDCRIDPFQVANRVTREFVTRVEFQGWSDPVPLGSSPLHASSIESYQITVNEVPSTPGKLKVDYLSNVFTKTVKVDETEMQLNLTSTKPGLYCITLEVKDVADNVRQTRRFILYDNTSSIETNNEEPFLITSASVQSNFAWQTHHHNICLSWKDHFLNRFYFDNILLNPIEPAPHGFVTGVYEQNDGLLPVSGTPNVYGIVKYMISWSLNNGPKSSETAVPDFQNQSFCNDFKVSDGQTYNIVVRPIDITGNTYMENRTVHIDRSAPHINNIRLMKDGYKALFVLHQSDLSIMELQFEALDPHSGIKMVEWAFGISDTGKEITKGALSVGAIDELSCPQNSEACYCPDVGYCEFFHYIVPLDKLGEINKHEGGHNRTYYFNIKVTNHADLFYKDHVDILVNDSHSEVGVAYKENKGSQKAMIVGVVCASVISVLSLTAVILYLLRKIRMLKGTKIKRTEISVTSCQNAYTDFQNMQTDDNVATDYDYIHDRNDQNSTERDNTYMELQTVNKTKTEQIYEELEKKTISKEESNIYVNLQLKI